jgi:hypothetical protein
VLPSSALFTVASFPFHYISLLITFTFDDFESVLKNFSLAWTISNFRNFGLGNDER